MRPTCSAARLHYRLLVLDGAFSEVGHGEVRFHEASHLRSDDWERLQATVRPDAFSIDACVCIEGQDRQGSWPQTRNGESGSPEATARDLDSALFWTEVNGVQGQIAVLSQRLTDAQREARSAEAEWEWVAAAIDETRNIDDFWDDLSIAQRFVICNQSVVAVFIAVERIEDHDRGHPRTAIVYLAGAPRDPKLVPLNGPNASSISSLTQSSGSASSRARSKASEEPIGIRPNAQEACPRTSGSGSQSASASTVEASAEPQLPKATQTFRANPALPARRIGDPRENASQASSESAVVKSSVSGGAFVPGCEASGTNGSGSTPTGRSPGPRAA
jgi:hypothetical protein